MHRTEVNLWIRMRSCMQDAPGRLRAKEKERHDKGLSTLCVHLIYSTNIQFSWRLNTAWLGINEPTPASATVRRSYRLLEAGSCIQLLRELHLDGSGCIAGELSCVVIYAQLFAVYTNYVTWQGVSAIQDRHWVLAHLLSMRPEMMLPAL